MTGNTMGGRRHADRPGAVPDAEVTVPGRHRVRADGTWTPVVPPRAAGHHRHRTGGAPAGNGAPTQRGSENPQLRGAPAPRANRVPDDGNRPAPNQPVFPTASGTLPLAEPPLPQPRRRRATSDPRGRRAPVEPPRHQSSAPDRLAEPRQTAAFPGQPAEPRGRQAATPAQPVAPHGQQAAPPARQPESRTAFAPPQDRIPEEHRAFAPPENALPQPTRRTRQERVTTTSAALANRPESPRERVELNPVAEEPPRRQRVTLGEPAVSPQEKQEQQDDEVRVYSAPLLDGLGTFDLGSVPASVTPPKTWRKAAWFATGASGAVVVGLLFAGTFLVGGPATTTTDAVGGGWPGRQNGGNPNLSALIPNEQHGGIGGNVPHRDSSTSPDGVTSDNGTHPQQGGGPSSSASSSSADVTTSAGPGTGGRTSAPTTTDSPSSSEAPEKPPVTPAQRETKPPPYFTTNNAGTMGDNSEKFLNNVTTDPSAASSVTSGDLKQEGPQGLRKRYADVAYFEVKKVTIDPEHGTTVNTVEVTHQDGSKSTEQQTLTFDDNGKITDDGR
ncbi:hypothetical protein [Amycolatopsis rubida]|uniref:Uncharacterized protein n=1 Tax=Amycolatopsis rubida TaxID=112413 RepID=A0A1I5Y604_9PSEU|nr:hypothetical protein [Amycolatopsis rubida]SFQ39619.1 hypothetical protein SAMN05421854_111239 [Amycolatopsis rubida]